MNNNFFNRKSLLPNKGRPKARASSNPAEHKEVFTRPTLMPSVAPEEHAERTMRALEGDSIDRQSTPSRVPTNPIRERNELDQSEVRGPETSARTFKSASEILAEVSDFELENMLPQEHTEHAQPKKSGSEKPLAPAPQVTPTGADKATYPDQRGAPSVQDLELEDLHSSAAPPAAPARVSLQDLVAATFASSETGLELAAVPDVISMQDLEFTDTENTESSSEIAREESSPHAYAPPYPSAIPPNSGSSPPPAAAQTSPGSGSYEQAVSAKSASGLALEVEMPGSGTLEFVDGHPRPTKPVLSTTGGSTSDTRSAQQVTSAGAVPTEEAKAEPGPTMANEPERSSELVLDSLPPIDALDGDADRPAIAAAPSRQATESQLSQQRGADISDLFAVGDFSGALSMATDRLSRNPDDRVARRYAQKCEDVLMRMYLARIGSLDRIVESLVERDQVRWLSIDHRAGFLLSLVDNESSVEELLDISGMPRLDALRILLELEAQRVVSLHP